MISNMENFSIFPNSYKEEGSKQPDYKVSVKEGDNFVEWGACWKKQGKNGAYLSCSKSKPMPTGGVKKVDYPAAKDEGINPDDIPFD